MNPAAGFFFAVLAMQLIFTGTLVWIVARRFPARSQLYRFLAPAAVPIFLLGIVFFGVIGAHHQYTIGFDGGLGVLFFRLFLAYAVLWLVGVLWASMIGRWARR